MSNFVFLSRDPTPVAMKLCDAVKRCYRWSRPTIAGPFWWGGCNEVEVLSESGRWRVRSGPMGHPDRTRNSIVFPTREVSL